MRIIDAHHHLWDLEQVHYPWLMARGVKRFFGDPAPIQKNYLVSDLREDAREFELIGSVHVQVGVESGDEFAETEFLQHTGDREGLPSAIVAFAELESEQLEDDLLCHRAHSRVRGVRQIIGRSAKEDALTRSGDLLDNPRWREGLRSLSDLGMSFDLQLTPPQMIRCAEVFSSVPELKVALCHCGSPWDQTPAGLRDWREGLVALAALENTHCKISGLGMFNHTWTAQNIRPIVETVIEVFGVERCMFGSNFPVDKLHADYTKVWRAFDELTRSLSASERERLFVANAAEFYRI